MLRRRLVLATLLSVLLAGGLCAGLAWLLYTPAGLQATAAFAIRLSGNRLQLEQPSGRLIDRLQIERLQWQDASLKIDISGVALQWFPLELLRGNLHVRSLGLGNIDIAATSKNGATRLPDTLALPLGIDIEALDTGRLRVNGTLIANSITGRFESHAGHHRLTHLSLQRGGVQLDASGDLAAQAPYPLSLEAHLSSRLDEAKPLMLALTAQGSLQHLKAKLQQSQGPFLLRAETVLRPFAQSDVIETLVLTAKQFDLAALLPELPHTQIDADCNLAAAQTGDAATAKIQPSNCRIDNRLDGPIDKNLLPLRQLSAHLGYRDAHLHIDDLHIDIGKDRGYLDGSATATPGGLLASLAAHDLDLAALHSRLRPTHLSGPITLHTDTTGRALKIALSQDQLRLRAALVEQGDLVRLDQFDISERDARLTLQGNLQTQTHAFSIVGTFVHFDPAQLLRAPVGDLNGDFKIGGTLGPALQARLSFALQKSSLAAAPALGKGELEIAWPRIPKADVALDLGNNHLRLHGAFGGAGHANDALHLDIDAPALTPYGIEGDLQAHLNLAGTLTTPQLTGHVESARLRVPDYGRLEALDMHVAVGNTPTAPLTLKLSMARLDLAIRRNSIHQLNIDLHGTRHAHQLAIHAQLDEDTPLAIAAHGGFDDKTGVDWHGALTQLQMGNSGGDSDRFIRLTEPVVIELGPTHWNLNDMRLQTPRAHIDIRASAQAGQMQFSARVDNTQLGQVNLEVQSKAADAWGFSAQMPWQGHLRADITELAWVNPLLGGNWQVGGRLHTDINLGGTPQFPVLNGSISASDLSLRQLDTALHLRNGSLRATLHNSVLDLDEFTLESVLVAAPPAVQKLLGAKAQELTATPGHVSARGRMALAGSPDSSTELSLDVTLDRLGVSQIPKQWLLLSGQSRISWQQNKLGIDAKLNVDAAHWQLADLSRPKLSDDVIIHREGDNSSETRQITPWTGRIHVDLGHYFSFAGAGARGRLAGQVDIDASAQDLARANGTVHLVDGHYDAYGQQLDIERGILNFDGLLENPALNIMALRKGLPVEAGVEITGFAQSPRIRLVSQPDVPDTEKLSWLVLGRPPEQEGADASILLAAVSAMFGNDTNSASQSIKQGFGIDELSVRNGALGQQQAIGSSVVASSNTSQSSGQVLTVGKQLSDRLRLSYEQALGTTGNLVKLTFLLSKRLSIVGTSGSDAALDIFYGFSFGGTSTHKRSQKD